MTTPFIRSMLSWQQAVALKATPPCQSSLFSGIDLEKATFDPSTANEWAAFLAFMARNFENMIAEAVPAYEAHIAEIEQLRTVLDAIREAHGHAKEHVTMFAKSREPLAFVRSLCEWQHVLVGAAGQPCPFPLLPPVDLERAAVDRAFAEEWVSFLVSVTTSLAKMLSDAERKGVRCPNANAEAMLSESRSAYREAMVHVASLVEETAGIDHGSANVALT